MQERYRLNRNERRRIWRENGICISCGERPAAPKVMCFQCSVRYAGYQAERYKRLKENGICRQCGKAPAEPSQQDPTRLSCLCADCREKRREYIKCRQGKQSK